MEQIQEITPAIAFEILSHATGHSSLVLNRNDTLAVIRALEVVKSVIDVAAAAEVVVKAGPRKRGPGVPPAKA